MEHKPVLLREVIEYLDPKSNQNFIDCTFGGGGHTTEILSKTTPGGRVLGIEASGESLEKFKIQNSKSKIFKDRLILINDNFRNLRNIYANSFHYPVSGILLDLGLSSMELADESRGFGFLTDGPLDMRFDQKHQDLTAGEILNKYPLENLVKIFCDYGEVPRSQARLVSEAIGQERKIRSLRTVADFLRVVLKTLYPRAWERGEITGETKNFYHHRRKINHPATQFFQALRIAVNDELGSLREVLPAAEEVLAPKGRIVVISFHSLEDRIVKNFFRDEAKAGRLKILTKKPLVADEAERQENPRSRSAKLRVAEKVN
ncbi:16S rRNA (cytosine(1402)-N(4))-methyltransferase RsmH [Candidatus Kuenenbacteria bacterium]|nr:16S rRNA (cytosine(1402)-N(4))-methyltransferase RsmH [Candidatus Kuenenbacteria bacterium]